MTLMIRHLQQWIANVANGFIDPIGINEANYGSPMLPLAPLTPMASITPMAPMNRHLLQWIANFSYGAIGANDVIDTLGFYWRLWKTHRHEMAPKEPFELHHWSPMEIVIVANGHDRHWRQW